MVKLATIAGSDASGGAGLEADLKTFQEYGGYGMAAITFLTVSALMRQKREGWQLHTPSNLLPSISVNIR